MALLSEVTSAIGFMPTGTVLPYAGRVPPSGWLFCDGQAVSRTTHARLFDILSPPQTCNTNNLSTTVTVQDSSVLSVGTSIFGAGIPAAATVSSITNATTVVISAAATATATGVTLRFGGFGYGPAPLGTTFNIPDFRGRFIRGWNAGSTGDPDRTLRARMLPGGSSGGSIGDNVGSVQGIATAKADGNQGGTKSTAGLANSVNENDGVGVAPNAGEHSHTFPIWNSGSGNGFPASTALSFERNNNTSSAGTHSHSVGVQVLAQPISGDNETRPINAYLSYIIKI